MSISKFEKENTVDPHGQLEPSEFVSFTYQGEATKVLFVGNSITRHEINEKLGWLGDWGMAASTIDKDYVHQTVRMLEERGMKVDYCVAQVAEWEFRFNEDLVPLEEHYANARAFAADIVIIRAGENMRRCEAMENEGIEKGKPYFDNMIRYFCSNPNARVIVTDSFWPMEERDRFIREICQERGYTFCKISDLGVDEKYMATGLYRSKAVCRHPGDLGMEEIAKRLVALI